MSFTARYSELLAIRNGEVQSPNSLNAHPRILDPDGFESVPENVDVSKSVFKGILVKGEEEVHSEYPKQTWEVLKGFKSWKPRDAFGLDHDPDLEDIIKTIEGHEDYRTGPLGYGYNIERLGIPYNGVNGEWKTFFAEVSRHTEAFAFYHSPIEHEWPDVTNFEGGEETVYYVEANDGDVYAEEQTFRRTNVEPLVEETERVGTHELTDLGESDP